MSDNKSSERVKKRAEIKRPADLDTPNTSPRVEVTADDLPLHCPMTGKRLWDSHPKVYLPIEDSGQAQCPYCGTTYIFKGSLPSAH